MALLTGLPHPWVAALLQPVSLGGQRILDKAAAPIASRLTYAQLSDLLGKDVLQQPGQKQTTRRLSGQSRGGQDFPATRNHRR